MKFECQINVETRFGKIISKSIEIDDKQDVKYECEDDKLKVILQSDDAKDFKKGIASVIERMNLSLETINFCESLE